MAAAQDELLSRRGNQKPDPAQGTLFPIPQLEHSHNDKHNEDAEFPNAEALLSLFHFSRQGLDYTALALCVRHFHPLSSIFKTKEEDLKEFFNQHSHIGGYLACRGIANPKQQKDARRYAKKQATLLSKAAPGSLLIMTDSDFPQELTRAKFAVSWIFCHPKRFALPPVPRIAVVGSRNSTEKQLEIAKKIALKVNELGGVVVTGMAAGADAAAYEAVSDKPDSVIGVIGTGIQQIYPVNHKAMIDKLCQSGGFVLSELPPDFPGNRLSFVLRNRIIATLSDIVVAVSGKYASGTSHTIRFAKEAGIPILSADPDERSGMTQLVKELGGCIATTADIEERVQQIKR